VVAYRIEDPATGGVLVYAPCLAVWPDGFGELISGASLVVLDGTFHSYGELSDGTCAAGSSLASAVTAKHTRAPDGRTPTSTTRTCPRPGLPRAQRGPRAGVELPLDGTEFKL
jgi:pyrroloquinoline quinone biosynthesis protein B